MFPLCRNTVNSTFTIYDLTPNTTYKMFVYGCHAQHQILTFERHTKYDRKFIF